MRYSSRPLFDWDLQRQASTDGGHLWLPGKCEGKTSRCDAHPRRWAASVVARSKISCGRGYAALSVNWGGNGDGVPPFNSPDGAQPDDPTPIGERSIRPNSMCPGYHSMLPGPNSSTRIENIRKNNNWYLLTLGCRRGLTFLEQQPEVDANRLGVHGYSMGGNLTMYVAGSD